MDWWSIEVRDGEQSAARWWDSYAQSFTEAAITGGAQEWHVQQHDWGVVVEVAFADESRWERFRALPLVQAALDAAPDPVNGLLIYRGRGGSAGRAQPRGPRPLTGAGAAELPGPDPDPWLDLTSTSGGASGRTLG